ncbi:allantoicase [Kiloniella majae]|uniref:allantoicase n=1 Tax=Kiloniella majae TaxID=1938558 RepID=UPI000A278522|nr:allantoicase [Kiloniella majae]
MSNSELEKYAAKYVNLASPKFGTQVVSATDEFFAAKERMIADSDAVFIEGKFDDHGKWMDGWESRRRRGGGHDHCLIRLGAKGTIRGVDIDTSHFTGNYPPAASIEACVSVNEPDENSTWVEIVPATSLGASAHHFVKVEDETPYNWLRLHIYPDGGVARLRVYGEPFCDWDGRDATGIHELSALINGGRVVGYNDAHYGNVWSLLTAGRGVDMEDGWETRRRREPGNDWIVIALGHVGTVDKIEVDTAHFKGNYPNSCSICAAHVSEGTDESIITQSMFWDELLPQQKLQADNIHIFDSEHFNASKPITHVRLNIFPDGGISRLRIFGRLAK